MGGGGMGGGGGGVGVGGGMSKSATVGAMATRRPSLPPLPDLSHLTQEERKVIEDVLRRQKEEEDKEHEAIRWGHCF